MTRFEAGAWLIELGQIDAPALVPNRGDEQRWNNAAMSFLSDYFTAPSDEAAAGAITDVLSLSGWDVLQAKGLIPGYHLLPVEVLLTGRTADAVQQGPRHNRLLASVDDQQVVVVTVSDELMASLAAASTEQLTLAAQSWSHFEDVQGVDASLLAGFLGDLAALARRAASRQEHLYCKLSCLHAWSR